MQILIPGNPHHKALERKKPRIYVHSDCVRDSSGRSRIEIYAESLGFHVAHSYGITNPYQAEMHMVDDLDVHQDPKRPMTVAINVAPRHCSSLSKGQNGTPFVYTRINKHVLISTLSRGLTFSLLRKVGVNCSLTVLDTEDALNQMFDKGFIRKQAIPFCRDTQFRSLWFEILAAAYLSSGSDLNGERLEQPRLDDQLVAEIDRFGNIKTTALPGEIGFQAGHTVPILGQQLPCYQQLMSVPKDTLGACIGSSGYNEHRFVEAVVQGGDASERLEAAIGDNINRPVS